MEPFNSLKWIAYGLVMTFFFTSVSLHYINYYSRTVLNGFNSAKQTKSLFIELSGFYLDFVNTAHPFQVENHFNSLTNDFPQFTADTATHPILSTGKQVIS